MIIMKRIVFSLGNEYCAGAVSGPLLLYRSFDDARPGILRVARTCGAAPLTCRTDGTRIDTFFDKFSRSVSLRKHLLAGRLPGLHHIVERPHLNSTSRRGFFFNCRVRGAPFLASFARKPALSEVKGLAAFARPGNHRRRNSFAPEFFPQPHC